MNITIQQYFDFLATQKLCTDQVYEASGIFFVFFLVSLVLVRKGRIRRTSVKTVGPSVGEIFREEKGKPHDEFEHSLTQTVEPAPGAFEKSKLPEVPQELPLSSEGEIPSPASLDVPLEKTRTHFFSRLANIFRGGQASQDEIFAGLEELLITSDLGVKATQKFLETLKSKPQPNGVGDEGAIRELLREEIETILQSDLPPAIDIPLNKGLKVILVVGVNGVGKTTTIAKLAEQFRRGGAKVLLGACDTFRAAAADQLGIWAERIGVDIELGTENEKPSTVAYRAVHRAVNDRYDVLLVDTAGRLHTRANLMNELKNVAAIISREHPGAPQETILVLDASTGQNALQQAREFHGTVTLTGLVITKLDGTPKGGIVVAIKDELGVPIRYIGIGEGVEDLQVFNPKEFVKALFVPSATSGETAMLQTSTKVRRRRRAGEEEGAVENGH